MVNNCLFEPSLLKILIKISVLTKYPYQFELQARSLFQRYIPTGFSFEIPSNQKTLSHHRTSSNPKRFFEDTGVLNRRVPK